eukprot:403347211
MFFREQAKIPLNENPQIATLQAQFYKFMDVNKNTQEDLNNGAEILIPQITKYILQHRIGNLPYEVCKDQVNYNTKQRIEQIEKKRIELSQRKHSPNRHSHTQSDFYGLSSKKFKTNSEISQGNLSLYDLGAQNEEQYDDVNLFFGEEAKENFWDLYKSERRFKDYDQQTDQIADPRFAYLQACKELKVNPRARMIIREEKTSRLDYSNYILLNKTAMAVAESIKRYILPIESINFVNNGLKTKDCIILIDSLQKHYEKLQILKLSKNKMGIEGAKHLAGALKFMKELTQLDLAENEIGDQGIKEIVTSIKDYSSLEYLDLSGNNIGQSSFMNENAEAIHEFLTNNRTLEILKLNWNNIRGNMGVKIIEGLISCYSIKQLHINNNLLGVGYDDKEPPISKMAELLTNSKTLEYLDLSFNFIEQKSIFCISHGLKFTSSLKNIIVEGNPIGPVGVFDPQSPEKAYSLNMAETYDHIILQNLLQIAEKSAGGSEGKFDIKACFQGVKYNGKPSWSPPLTKDQFNQFEIQEHTGLLTFTFTINPILYKLQQIKHQQMMEQQAQANPDKPQQIQQPQGSIEIIEADFIQKPLITQIGVQRLMDMIIQSFQDEDDHNQEQLIKNLAKEHMIWSSQANELLYAVKNQEVFCRVAPYLMNRAVDRHNRFSIVNHFGYMQKQIFSQLYNKMGHAFYFSFWNPNGHYEINLANHIEREIAVSLIVINKEAYKKVAAGERADRSQMGNKSCFRNEKINGQTIIYNFEWQLPSQGILEFDFVYLQTIPLPDDITPQEKVDQLIEWFKYKYEVEKSEIQGLAKAFQSISEFLTLRSEQLAQFVDLIDDPMWKTEIFCNGVGIIYDYRNNDFIKHRVKFPEAIRDIYKRFGILNLFNPFRPNGSYRLDLQIYEERIVCKILLELAKQEGFAQMTNVSMDGKGMETVSKEFVDKLGESGVFEGTYICLPANIREDVREKMAAKYLDWQPI